MSRQRRLNYALVVALYENNYGQVAIGKMMGTPHGHISKLLRGQNVPTRARGTKVTPVSFPNLDKETQALIMSDKEFFKTFQEFTGYTHVVKKAPVKKKTTTKKKATSSITKKVVKRTKLAGWDEMSIKEKGKIIQDKINEGNSTRQVANELGIAQSTLVSINNMYLYGTRTKPVNA